MAKTVKQNSVEPTNKTTAATVGAGAMSALYWILEQTFPGLPNEQLIIGLTPLAVYAAGFWFRDKPNVVVSNA